MSESAAELTQQRYLLECAKAEERERGAAAAAAHEAAIRRDERERCRDRINALIEAMPERAILDSGWHAARLSALMAARSAVMRGDDGEGAPVQ